MESSNFLVDHAVQAAMDSQMKETVEDILSLPGDEGPIRFECFEYKDRVVVRFPKPILTAGYSPAQAREFAKALRQAANQVERLRNK